MTMLDLDPAAFALDGCPPERVLAVQDAASGLDAFIVLDDRALGPAFGGIRFRSYPDRDAAARDAARLAHSMTLKCALAELPAGGGKAVVRVDGLTDRAGAVAVLGDAIEALGGAFRTAGDLGATADDLERIAARTAYVARPAQTGDLSDSTALGCIAALAAVAPRLGHESVRGLRVLVQGAGGIGLAFARRLHAAGARVSIAEVAAEARDRALACGLRADVDPAAVFEQDVDVFAPCADGGILDDANCARLRARAVVGGANNLLADARAGEILRQRGVCYAPDVIVNAGAVIRGVHHALWGVPAHDAVIARIGPRLAALLDEASAREECPDVTARRRAQARVDTARAGR